MTDQEINSTIAQACGWKKCTCDDPECEFWLPPGIDDTESADFCLATRILPDYCNDLNAMHEAEKTLMDSEEVDYDDHLLIGLARDEENGRFVWNASARQRAEAFLRVKGLWRED